jgi:hypothetical protein
MEKPTMFKQTLASVALLAAMASSAQAGIVTLAADGQWNAFDIDELTSMSSGLEWIELDGDALSFEFSLATQGTLTVVDGAFAGDEFEVFNNGVSLGFTSISMDPDSTSVGTDFDAAFADHHRYSYAEFILGPGSYSITGLLTASALDIDSLPYNATVGAVRLNTISAVPVPAAAWLLGSGLAAGLGCVRRRAA